jgi:predicted RNase H-like HicB family nuclease
MATRTYTVIYELAEQGGYYAHIPALEVTTEGETLEEAKEMARDAIDNTLACLTELNLPFPQEVASEQIGAGNESPSSSP